MSTQIDRITGLVGNLGVKAPCNCASVGALTLVGEQTVDGYACTAADNGGMGTRVLYKDDPNPVLNGVYYCNASAWQRAPDFDGQRDVAQGTRVFVTGNAGVSTNVSIEFEVTTANPINVGTSGITFASYLATSFAPTINAAPAKNPLVAADKFGIWDSVTGLLKSFSWANLLAVFSAPSGSSLIGYQPAGTGAVATTMRAKLQQELSSSDASPFSQWVTNVTGTIGRLLNGTTTVTSQTNVPASTTIIGDGRGSILATMTASMHLLGILATGVLVRAVSLSGIKGTNVLNNSAIVFSSATDSAVEDCEAFGMSGYAFYVTASDNIRLENNYVHGLTGDATYTNSCDIGLYQATSYNTVKNNRLMGGAQTELAVMMQLNSTNNLVDGNTIGAHYSYGIIDYDTTPRITYNTIVNNRIQDIDGSTNGAGTKGAGIYCAGTGGQLIAHNQVRNTNINTTTEVLVPGAIGINTPFSPVYVGGNAIHNANWYGAMVASATQIASILGNIVFESLKIQIYIKSSSHALVCNNSITALTTTPLTQRGIAFNVAGGGTWTGCSAIGNRIRGSTRGIESGFTNNILISDNNISEVNGSSIRISACVGGVVSNNVCDSTVSASAATLDISGAQNISFTGNMLNSQSTTCVSFAGTNTGSVFNESNVVSISGVRGGMNNIDNTTAGCLVTQYGTAAPALLNHQVGDRVINSAPAVGNPKAWVCTVAGLPGTWVSEGNL